MENSKLKFRAWDKNRNSWIEECDLIIESNERMWVGDANNPPLVQIEPKYVVFFTGFKDKNFKEIYEGDIVRIKEHALQRDEKGIGIYIDGNYVVKWSKEMELILAPSLESEEGWLLSKNLHYTEVIGNIFEHKHLLEGTE